LKGILEKWHHRRKSSSCEINREMAEAEDQNNLKIHIYKNRRIESDAKNI
jgi:hypothetical protein